jgi:hypothetical protein
MMYAPILRTKQGELEAFAKLGLPVAASIRPLFDVRLDQVHGLGEKEVLKIARLAKSLRKAWPWQGACAVDFSILRDKLDPIAQTLFNAMREQELIVVPVVTSAHNDDFKKLMVRFAREVGRGICLRLPIRQESSPASQLGSMRATLGMAPEEMDLVLDMGPSTELPAWLLSQGVAGFISSLVDLPKYRSFTLASTSAPKSMAEYARGSINLVPRREWALWKAICDQPKLVRCPDFGDYTAVHPEDVTFDPEKMRLGGKIRYTTEESWLFVKGGAISGKGGAKGLGFEQFRVLSKHLMKRPEYRGKDFSWGDAFIHDCAEGTGPLGNLRTWVSVAVNQHVSFVVHQLAKLAAS